LLNIPEVLVMLVRAVVGVVAGLHFFHKGTSSFADGEHRSTSSALSVAPEDAEEAEAEYS